MALDSPKTSETTEADRRNSARTSVPSIEIRCDGDMYKVKDWSVGGCQFENYTGELRPGDAVLVDFYLLGFHHCDGLPIKAEVIRFESENNNSLALKFLELNAQAIMNYCDSVEKNGAQGRN